jgi:hypothetical protein
MSSIVFLFIQIDYKVQSKITINFLDLNLTLKLNFIISFDYDSFNKKKIQIEGDNSCNQSICPCQENI